MVFRKKSPLSFEYKDFLNDFRNNLSFESWKRENEYGDSYYCEKCGRYKILLNNMCSFCDE
jgi:hypothetical protein